MRLTLSHRSLNQFLITALILIASAGVIAESSIYLWGADDSSRAVVLFNLSNEGNIPTFYSALLLVSCAALLGVIHRHAKRTGERFAAHWGFLACAFAYVAVDEAVQIHESLNTVIHSSGIFFYGWVIPAIIIVFIIGISYLGFLANLRRADRFRFVRAGAFYVGGAIGVELILGLWADAHGRFNLMWGMIDAWEETMEIAGLSLFVSALLQYISDKIGPLTLAIDTRQPASAQSGVKLRRPASSVPTK